MVGGGICGNTLLWLKKYTLLVEETHSLGSRNMYSLGEKAQSPFAKG